MIVYSYINTAKKILDEYDGKIPFSFWIKSFFKSNKKYGSKDRKEISSICFAIYRIGNQVSFNDFQEKVIVALFLTYNSHSYTLSKLKPEWSEKLSLPLHEKVNMVYKIDTINIFPFNNLLSKEIDINHFNLSFLIQPDLFLRIRPHYLKQVLKKIDSLPVKYNMCNMECVQLPVSSKIETYFELNKEVVIQDLNSQKTLDLIHSLFPIDYEFSAWDCCAASGGKTILLHDLYPLSKITVSDIRKSIIRNLINRLAEAEVLQYNYFIADLSKEPQPNNQLYDLIICDAPCSGSGTWSRTPEILRFFNKNKVYEYSSIQKKILKNIHPSLKKGGYLLYITCSVFALENEDIVNHLLKITSLQLIKHSYYKGYLQKSDTLFAALFKA